MRGARAKAYIESMSQSEELVGVPVETKVVAGATVQIIDEVACEEDADLVVLCSHGDTGFKRWLLGSVAQRLSRTCPVPVLVHKPIHQGGGYHEYNEKCAAESSHTGSRTAAGAVPVR